MDGKWRPICGHWFWDNNYGAKAFCKRLGYESGEFSDILFYDSIFIPAHANLAYWHINIALHKIWNHHNPNSTYSTHSV